MSDAGGTEETTDYSKMKVNDLKKILKARGLPMTGTKQELVDRLQTAEATNEDLLDGSEVGDELVEDEDLERELDESSFIGDDTVMDKTEEKKVNPAEEESDKPVPEPASSSPVKVSDSVAQPVEEKATNGTVGEDTEDPNSTQQKRKISLKPETAAASDAAKKKLRAERFGAGGQPASTEALSKRAERFAINSTTTSTAVTDNKVPPTEALKKRAERFGILSPAEQKRQHLEKLQQRKMRFSSTPSTVSSSVTTTKATIAAVPALPSGVKPTQLSLEERKKLRAQRFQQN